MKTTLTVMSNKDCGRFYNVISQHSFEGMICAGGNKDGSNRTCHVRKFLKLLSIYFYDIEQTHSRISKTIYIFKPLITKALSRKLKIEF